MKVKFLIDHPAGLVKGQVKELDYHLAKQLIALGQAEQLDGAQNMEVKKKIIKPKRGRKKQ